jgi:PAS domain S-box-containing protein
MLVFLSRIFARLLPGAWRSVAAGVVLCCLVGAAFSMWSEAPAPLFDRPLRVGIDQAPPFQMFLSDGTVEGLSVDMLGEAARRHGIPLVFVPIKGLMPDEAMRSGVVDIWPAAAVTEERRRWLHITEPWLRNRYLLVSITPLAPQGPRTIVQRRTPIIRRIVDQTFPHARIIEKADRDEAMRAMCQGEAEAALVESRYLYRAVLERPAGCEAVRLLVTPVDAITIDLAILAQPRYAGAADLLRAEIDHLAEDGHMATSLEKWSPFSSAETRSVYALREAQRSRKMYVRGTWVVLGCLLLFGWLQFRVFRGRKSEARLTSALTAEQERWGLALAANNDGLFDWDGTTGRAIYSPRWSEMLGLGADEFVGKSSWKSRIHPEDRPRVNEALAAYLERRSPSYQVKYRLRHGDGSWLWVLARAKAIWHADGRPLRLVGSHSDITESEAANERFRVLFESSSDAHLLIDKTGVIDCNEALVKMLGLESKRELLGQHPSRFSAERQPDGRLSRDKSSEMEELARERGYHRFDWMHRRPDGHEFPCEVALTPVSVGGHDSLLAVWHDLTERNAHEEQLRLLSSVVRESVSGIVITDIRERIIYVNPAQERMTGYCFGELVGAKPEEVFEGPATLVEPKLRIQEAIRDRLPVTIEQALYRKDGSFSWVEITLAPVCDLTGKCTHLVGVSNDITERRRAGQALAESQQRLQLALTAGELGLWDYHLVTRRLLYSESCTAMLGYAQSELEPNLTTWQRLVHPEDEDRVLELLEQYLKGHLERFAPEFRMRHKNGSWRWIQSIGQVVEWDSAGSPLRLAGTHQDVTARREIEAALRAKEAPPKPVEAVHLPDIDHAPGVQQKKSAVDAALAELTTAGFVKEDLQELIDCFLTNTPDLLKDLASAVSGEQLESAARLAHQLRGSLSSMGMRNLAGSLEVIERHCKHGDAGEAVSLLPNLKAEIAETCHAFAARRP